MNKIIFDNPIVDFLNLVGKLLILNLCWMICCIPVITIGAATSAMYSVMLKVVDESDGFLFTSYFKAFKKNFGQSTALWLIILAIGAVFGFDLYYGISGTSIIHKIFIFIAVAGFSITLNLLTLAFPLQARYKNTIKSYLKNSIIIAYYSPFKMILIWIVWALPILLTIYSYSFFRYLGFLWFICGFAAMFYFSSKIIFSIFRKVNHNEKPKAPPTTDEEF